MSYCSLKHTFCFVGNQHFYMCFASVLASLILWRWQLEDFICECKTSFQILSLQYFSIMVCHVSCTTTSTVWHISPISVRISNLFITTHNLQRHLEKKTNKTFKSAGGIFWLYWDCGSSLQIKLNHNISAPDEYQESFHLMMSLRSYKVP